MNILERALAKVGKLELKYFLVFLIGISIFTAFMAVGMTKVTFESDFAKFNPKGIPIIELNDKIDKEFAHLSTFLITLEVDEGIDDIRDPDVMNFLINLDKHLRDEQKIQDVQSAALFFQQGVPESLEGVKQTLSQIPQSDIFFNKAKSVTPVFLEADVGDDSAKIKEITLRVREIIANAGKPEGIKATVTGEPALGSVIFDLIIRDGIVTLFITLIAIFVLLLIITRSFQNAIVIITPVALGVIWTIGAMGWLQVPITVATAAIGAMILGLGTEYSIFLNSRYKEERIRRDWQDAIIEALSTTGVSTMSSGITTMIGFFALMFSFFPMLSDLGFSLGIGIGFVLASTMLGGPLVMIIQNKLKQQKGQKEAEYAIFDKYGKLVAHAPWLVLIVMLVVTGFVYIGSQRIVQEEVDFFNVLPQDLEELKAFRFMQNEFGDTTGVRYYVSLDAANSGSDEPEDIRDPRVVRYINTISQKAREIEYAISVSSISTEPGIIPATLREQKELLQSGLINNDFSATTINIEFDSDAAKNNKEEIIREIYEIAESTDKPAGVLIQPAGGMIEEHELNKILNPDSSRTGIISFVAIIIFLFIITRSIKYTILPLITVILAILWVFGLIGYFDIPFNSIISSVVSMTIGVGIDFGIQLALRFRHERQVNQLDKKTAMANTLKHTLYPMVVTVIAALVGFQAMRFGKLTLMGNLGTAMSFAVLSSMIVAVTIVASLILIFERALRTNYP
ncbi:MAG TPA: hydrophobe/amphiphile efflux-3 (HAE3) family transporter [Candidatus Nanoarchaeia archaeon]|nr:hydrophobe/amphiphile efflux-3 (HAE3) family transporter [Candidatus Nanoarchaeia archaeon]